MPNSPSAPGPPVWPKVAACFLVALAAGAFLWLNITTSLSAAPWGDEVMYVDAGVNLYLGHGWVSTAWPSQSQHGFWAANSPLYGLLVYGWISIFGFSPVGVRSLDYVLVLAVAWLIAASARRSGLLQSLWAQILLWALLVCNQTVTYVYRSARGDLVPLFVAALLFRIYTSVEDPRRRRLLLFFCATPMLASGLHVIPYVVLLLCLEYLFSRNLRIPDLAAIGLGCAAGSFATALLFLSKHSLQTYISQTFVSGYNILGAGLQAVVIRNRAAVDRFLLQVKALSPVSVLRTIGRDTSLMPLLLALVCLAILLWRAKGSKLRSSALAGLMAAVLITYGMVATGRYPIYYSWMGAIPVIVAFTVALEQSWLERKWTLVSGGALAAIASLVLGMPSYIWREVHKTPPDGYRAVEELLRSKIRPGDAVYGDPVLYYAAKAADIPFFSTTYAGGRGYPHMTDEERSSISLFAVPPEQVADSMEKLGPGWTPEGTHPLPYGFSLVVCTRPAQRGGQAAPNR